MEHLGTLKRLDPRQVWSNEASDFTPWLAEHLSVLGEALGFDLELKTQEAPVGDFSLDLLAHDLNRDRLVVIENQLNPTDHDHLGKLLTYASGFDASTVVWIAPQIREEHRQALDWLNQRSDEDTEFFGVVVEILQIDDSPPAVQFRPVAAPNEWSKERRRSGGATPPSAKGEAYQTFFQALVDELREKHRFTNARKAQPGNWYAFSSGVSSVNYVANFGHGGLSAQVYIDSGEQEDNKRIFDALHGEREKYDARFGEPLTWERLDDKRASRIAIYCDGRIEDPPETLSELRRWVIERLLKLKEVFGVPVSRIAG